MTPPEARPDPEPTAEDFWRADLLIEGGGFTGQGVRDLFAGGIAVARTGGDVADYLRRQVTR